jgi:hypothetical protein
MATDVAKAADDGMDTGAQVLVGACTASDPASCAYSPAQLYQPGGKVARAIVYTDITGAKPTVRSQLRRPMAGPEPSRIIVWSNGGSARDTAANIGVDWGVVFNRAGFVVIAIAHEGRGAEASRDLCLALNLGDCDLVSCNMGDVCTRGTAAQEVRRHKRYGGTRGTAAQEDRKLKVLYASTSKVTLLILRHLRGVRQPVWHPV